MIKINIEPKKPFKNRSGNIHQHIFKRNYIRKKYTKIVMGGPDIGGRHITWRICFYLTIHNYILLHFLVQTFF